MRREDAVMISDTDLVDLNTIEQIIYYLKDCYAKGLNVYYNHNGEILYSCDNYSFDDYYLLAMGISKKDYDCFNNLMYGDNSKSTEDVIKLNELLVPVFKYLKEVNEEKREELRNGNYGKRV